MKSLLIVDDEPKICSLLSHFFEAHGFRTRTAHSGAEAIQTLHAEVPDYLLLDIRMPGMSGLDVLRLAKKEYPHLRVVMVTALDNVEMAEQALTLGASHYVTKPFSFQDRHWARAFFDERRDPITEELDPTAIEDVRPRDSVAAATHANMRMRLGELLITKGLITPSQLEEGLRQQAQSGEYLGAALVRLGFLTETQLVETLAEQLKIPSVRLATYEIEPEALEKVTPKVASHYHLMPLALREGVLHVAIADPFDVQTLDELKLLLDCDVQPVLASQSEITDAIQRHYGVGASAVERLLDTAGAPSATPAPTRTEDLSAPGDDASVIAFVNQLISSAVKDRATDIHIEPFEGSVRIRQRIDGVLYELPLPPDLVKLQAAIVSRIKVMAALDIAEKRLPQDGRLKVRLAGQELDLRLSVLPTSFGETVALRILSAQMLLSLEHLGLAASHLGLLRQLLSQPHGIIFVTGPTGSGKTTTLYACLHQLNRPGVKILTIEDPVEYQLTGITQLQIHPKIGFSFAQGLRSMLRHDPDIMMVGEVRDPETAEITIRSALTGHLVFSTLHTNDAAGGVTRLLDMGIEPYLVASSVLGFIAQRLVRLNCPACTREVPTPPEIRSQLTLAPTEPLPPTVRQGQGCAACKGTGYKGRTAIYEFLAMSPSLQPLLLRRASAQELAACAQQTGGLRTLRQDGWLKVCRGLTTPAEVLRVT